MPATTEAKEKFTSLRISQGLLDRLSEVAKRVPGMSANALGVQAIEDILQMIETAEQERVVPKSVRVLDAVKEAAPKLLKKAKENPR